VKPKLGILVVFAAAVGIILILALRGGDDGGKAPLSGSASGTGSQQGGEPAPAKPIELVFEYSTEKKDWIEAAVVEFRKVHPEITVKLVGKGSLEAAQAILDGADKPTLWSPADSLITNLLGSDWETKNEQPLFAASGDAGPQPLLLSPLVFAVWEDRAKVLLDASEGALSWKAIEKAVASPKGWAAIGGKPGWGFVKLGHTDPTKSNSGLQALYLMTLEFYGKTSGIQVGDLLEEKYQGWISSIEKGVPKFESSTGTFMKDMVMFGPSKYDLAVVYESTAVSQLENAQGRWGSLHIYYPAVTMWSDHPVVVLDAEWVSAEQAAAAHTLIAYLRSPAEQSKALRHGFRPADPSVPIKTAESSNPFTRMGQFGLMVDLPPAALPPDGPVVRNLLMMWSRVAKPQ